MTHQFKKLFLVFTILFATFACKDFSEVDLEQDDTELRRIPFNQSVFLLNSKRVSEIFKVDYDFQGLTGDATLTKLPLIRGNQPLDLPRGGHMTVDPTKSYIVVSISKDNAIWVVDLSLDDLSGKHQVKRLPFNTPPGGITQVDFDQDDYLFIAGKGGFFRVSTLGGGNEIWNLNDGEAVEVSPFTFNADIELGDEGEDGEDYFEDLNSTDSDYRFLSRMQRRIDQGKFRFAGGDITFTQNDDETAGFEQERLITFTQWGNMAAHVSFEFGDLEMNYNARPLFRVRKVNNKNGRGTNKVTGGALMGDNLLVTSHHFTKDFSVWNLAGEELARPKFKFANPEEDFHLHNWGDMATTQTFDGSITNEDRVIGEEESFFPFFNGSQLAEVKLYRPGRDVTDNYDVSEDNPGVDLEARRNASNSDIADLRERPLKFTSLGGGKMILRFPTRVTVGPDTRLQVVETSWGRPATFDDKDEAFSSYAEKASVYVSDFEGQYYGAWAEDESNWTKVGDAFISSNTFTLDDIAEFNWVRIVDDGSETPDGFDVNFVAIYEESDDTDTIDPLCTNSTVILPLEFPDPFSPSVTLEALGVFVFGDPLNADTAPETGYRWRITNNSLVPLEIDWNISLTFTGGTISLPAESEIYFSTDIPGNMVLTVNDEFVTSLPHSGPIVDISLCDSGIGDQIPD